MSHEDCQSLFPDALYGELAPERKTGFEAHLESCASCASLFARMQKTVQIMSKRPAVEFPAESGERFWNNLERRIKREQLEKTANVFHFRPAVMWSYGIAAALLIGLGIVLGKFYFTRPAEPLSTSIAARTPASAPPAPRDSIDVLASNYLERSKMLLMSVINDGDEGAEGSEIMDSQRKLSRELLDQAVFLEANLTGPDQQRVKRLVADLQVILMELANVGNQQGVPLVEIVKSGVDKGSILLKINIEQMRALGTPASGTKTRKSSAPSHL